MEDQLEMYTEFEKHYPLDEIFNSNKLQGNLRLRSHEFIQKEKIRLLLERIAIALESRKKK